MRKISCEKNLFRTLLAVLSAGFLTSMMHVSYAEKFENKERTRLEILEKLDWRFVGPWRGGRVNAVVGHPSDKRRFLAGYTGGGVWETVDGGVKWRNLSDGQIKVGSIGAIDISASDPDIIYVGTGEQALRGDVSHGDGVYKSVDGGKTWTNVGLRNTRQIARIIVHPTDPNTVYVAALGHFTGPNSERGVFRSTDGGTTWERLLFVDENTGAVGLALDYTNPERLVAAMWDVRRFPWGIRSAGKGSGLYRTTDGGDSWQNISGKSGLPAGIKERMDVSISQSRPDRIWALMSAAEGKGLYRSDDFGDHWQRVSDDAQLTGRTYYFMKMLADPVEADTVYVLNYDLLRSTDGGETFRKIPTGHADHHAMWIDPRDNRRVIDGSDGGAQISFDAGSSWSSLYNQPTGQFYTLTLDDAEPFNLYGSQQDWSTLIVPSLARDADRGGYFDTGYSEAGHVAISGRDPNILFISDHHWLLRYDKRTDAIKYVGPRDETNYGWGTRDIRYRFNWTFPVIASMHDKESILVGSQYLHHSRDGGETWRVISPDLTRADPDKLERTPLPGRDVSGNERYWGPLTRDSNGDHWFSTLYTIAESPADRGTIWTGSDDGVVQLTRDGGETWLDVTPADLPEYAMITRIEASRADPLTAYFTASAYKLDDYRPFIFKTTDGGKSWQKITRGIEPVEIMRVVREDVEDSSLLYAGSETGVYVSFDNGGNWVRPGNNFPGVPVYDMKLKGDSIVVATHGRGFWAFDHLNIYRQLRDEAAPASDILFGPADVVRRDGDWDRKSNPPAGALIHYWLANTATSLFIEILDETDEVLARFDTNSEEGKKPSVESGLNSFLWDLRLPNATVVPGVVTRGNTNVGPTVVPGFYKARLVAGGSSHLAAFQVLPDPNVSASRDDLREQFEFLLEVRDKINEVNLATMEIRDLMSAIDGFKELSPEAAAIRDRLSLIERKLVQPNARYRKDLHANPVQVNDKLYRLANFVARSHSKPTQVQYELRDEFFGWADGALAEFAALKRDDILRFNKNAPGSALIEAGGGSSPGANAPDRDAMPRK